MRLFFTSQADEDCSDGITDTVRQRDSLRRLLCGVDCGLTKRAANASAMSSLASVIWQIFDDLTRRVWQRQVKTFWLWSRAAVSSGTSGRGTAAIAANACCVICILSLAWCLCYKGQQSGCLWIGAIVTCIIRRTRSSWIKTVSSAQSGGRLHSSTVR